MFELLSAGKRPVRLDDATVRIPVEFSTVSRWTALGPAGFQSALFAGHLCMFGLEMCVQPGGISLTLLGIIRARSVCGCEGPMVPPL